MAPYALVADVQDTLPPNSGLSVEDPNKKKKKKDHDQDEDAPNDMVKRLLKKAAEWVAKGLLQLWWSTAKHELME